MKRDAYRKLMNLGSAEADLLLKSKFEELDKSIRAAKSNDEIVKQLEALEQFTFKFSDETVVLIKFLLDREPIKPKKYSTQYGKVEGKSYGEVVAKCLEILNQLRYYQTPAILPLYHQLYVNGLQKQLEDKIKSLAEFNLQALEHVGYKAQADIIDYFKTTKPKTDTDIDFFIEVVRHLVSTEGEMQRMQDENTLVFGFAPLPFNEQLVTIRTWLLEEFEKLLNSPELPLSKKLKVLELLHSMTHNMMRGEPSKELKQLIKDNEKATLLIYKNLLFKNGKLVGPLPIALVVSEKILFMKKHSSGKLPPEAEALIKAFAEDPSYGVYDTLLGDKLDRIDATETYEKIMERTKKEREELLAKIDSPDHPAIAVLSQIAEYIGEIDDWKLNDYYGFLVSFAREKTLLANQVLNEAVAQNTGLVKAAGHFLWGFREAGAEAEYKNALKIIINKKMAHSLHLVAYSLSIGSVIDNDLKVATDLVNRTGDFAFIKADSWPSYLHALTGSLAQRLKNKDPEIKALFLKLLSVYDKYSNIYFGAIDVGSIRSEFKIEDFDPDIKADLMLKLVDVGNLSYDHQNILLKLINEDVTLLLSFFAARIKYAESHTKLRHSYEYDAVPYHLNDELLKVVSETSDYNELFTTLLNGFSAKWSYSNAETAQLLKQLGGYRQPLLDYIKKANKDGLKKVVLFCHSVDPIDTELAFEIIKKTSDKGIWSSVSSLLYATGMVSGEHGIENAHQARHDEIKAKYLNSKNARIREFAKMEVESLEKSIKAERQRTEEDLRLRKVDFEH
jgi:hypothetical protein